jgi:hypothetical protein
MTLALGLVSGLVMPLFFVVLRAICHNTWVAAIAFVLFFSVPVLVKGDVHGTVNVALWTSLQLFLFLRFGVLTVAVGSIAWRLLAWAVTFDFSAPHIDIGLAAHLLVAGLAIYGFLMSLDKQPTRTNSNSRISSRT